MTKQDIKDIKQLLSTPQKIIIVPHKNPDGDAIGSTLALYHYLKKYNHDAVIIAPNDYPKFLKWLPEENKILKYDEAIEKCDSIINEADIVFTLDFNSLSRTGNMEVVLAKSDALKIMIDHHQQPDDYAKYMYSDVSMSSTCEMVYNFINMLDDNDKIDTTIATCIYVGIMTDTGSFRFKSTTSNTHKVVADLIDKGANNVEIHNLVYDSNSFNRLQLLGKALSNLRIIPEYNTAYISLSQSELNSFNFKKGDTEGVVNYALSINNTRLAVIFIEDEKEGIIKMSLRSKGNFSVNELARKHFNGGGHTNAAGGRSELTLDKTIAEFISILADYKNELAS